MKKFSAKMPVKLNMSDPFLAKYGVKQGCALSFINVMDPVVRTATSKILVCCGRSKTEDLCSSPQNQRREDQTFAPSHYYCSISDNLFVTWKSIGKLGALDDVTAPKQKARQAFGQTPGLIRFLCRILKIQWHDRISSNDNQ